MDGRDDGKVVLLTGGHSPAARVREGVYEFRQIACARTFSMVVARW
jgi:hypothetical protein